LLALSDPEARAACWAGRVAPDAACEARFCAFCWRPRAWPPFRAAARRLVADAPCDLLDDALPERLEDEREERPDDPREAVLRPRELEDDFRELDDVRLELDELRDEPDLRAAPLRLAELLRVWAIWISLPTS
jgi:hypothetical protein